MLYSVEEIASKLNVSKVTIYNKLKLNQFKDKVLIKQGKSMIDDTLLNLLKQSIKLNTTFTDDDNSKSNAEEGNPQYVTFNDDIVNINKELIKALLEQLKEKDLQIHELHKLIENNQVLLKEKPQQDLLQLEEHFTELDSKLVDIRQQMQERKKQQEQQPKGIFQKIFKK